MIVLLHYKDCWAIKNIICSPFLHFVCMVGNRQISRLVPGPRLRTPRTAQPCTQSRCGVITPPTPLTGSNARWERIPGGVVTAEELAILLIPRGLAFSRQLWHGISGGHPDSRRAPRRIVSSKIPPLPATSRGSVEFHGGPPPLSSPLLSGPSLPLGKRNSQGGRKSLLGMETVCAKLELPLRSFSATSCSYCRPPKLRIPAPNRCSRLRLAIRQEKRSTDEVPWPPALEGDASGGKTVGSIIGRSFFGLAAATGAAVLLSCSSPAIAESLTVAFPVSRVREVNIYDLNVSPTVLLQGFLFYCVCCAPIHRLMKSFLFTN